MRAAIRSCGRRSPRSLRNDRGAAGPVTAAIVVPVLLLLIAGIIQGGLWFVARNAALTAAEEGARAMAGQNAQQGDGCAIARDFATRAAHGLFEIDGIDCQRGQDATVTVTGRGVSMIPGLPALVRQSASFPIEKVS